MLIYKLDLHRKRHIDVRDIVIRFIEEHWYEEAELEIITGNSNKMKEIVVNVLDEYSLEYRDGRPFDLYNNGYIVTWTEGV